MPFYHATARKAGSAAPFRTMFEATDNIAAVGELCDAAGVHSTSGLTEFEILLVLGNQKYQLVASKPSRDRTWNPPEADDVKPTTESTYVPYTSQKAA